LRDALAANFVEFDDIAERVAALDGRGHAEVYGVADEGHTTALRRAYSASMPSTCSAT
jgi:hypothetical protein